MLGGGLMMTLSPTPRAQFTGRLVAGIGGVLLNVLMTKMAADWFAGKEMATAMGVFANSWPVGIALSLVATPWLVAAGGVTAAYLAVVVLIGLSLLLLLAFYEPPPEPDGAKAAAAQGWPGRRVMAPVILTGLIWGLYNAGLGVVFGFGTLMLTERGWSLTAAASSTSIVLWLMALSVPLGGLIGDRTGRHVEVLVASLIAFAAGLVMTARSDDVVAMLIGLGLVAGLPAGLIVSLPMRVLSPATRAIGMGIFFTIFYTAQFAGPWAAGRVAAVTGTAAATFDLGAGLLVAATICVLLFSVLARQGMSPAAAPSPKP
jgi:MFS family permease